MRQCQPRAVGILGSETVVGERGHEADHASRRERRDLGQADALAHRSGRLRVRSPSDALQGAGPNEAREVRGRDAGTLHVAGSDESALIDEVEEVAGRCAVPDWSALLPHRPSALRSTQGAPLDNDHGPTQSFIH